MALTLEEYRNVKASGIASREANFDAIIRHTDSKWYGRELALRVTHNGFQWNEISLTPSEAEHVHRILSLALGK